MKTSVGLEFPNEEIDKIVSKHAAQITEEVDKVVASMEHNLTIDDALDATADVVDEVFHRFEKLMGVDAPYYKPI